MESSKSLTKRLSFAELEMFNKHDSQIAINNSELKDKTGNEILNMLKVDFVHSNIAKGISDFEVSYIPDFGYKDVLQFGEDFQNYPSGWKVMLD